MLVLDSHSLFVAGLADRQVLLKYQQVLSSFIESRLQVDSLLHDDVHSSGMDQFDDVVIPYTTRRNQFDVYK